MKPSADGGLCFDHKRELLATGTGQDITRTTRDGQDPGFMYTVHLAVNKARHINAMAYCRQTDRYVITDIELNTVMILHPKENSVKSVSDRDLNRPLSVSSHEAAPHKLFVVSDCYNHCIKFFKINGHLKHTLGSYGNGPGQLFRPFGVCMDKKGRVVVCDFGNKRIVRFTISDYSRNGYWELLLTPEQLHNKHPCHVDIDSSGHMVVSLQSDTGIDQIALFSGYQ